MGKIRHFATWFLFNYLCWGRLGFSVFGEKGIIYIAVICIFTSPQNLCLNPGP